MVALVRALLVGSGPAGCHRSLVALLAAVSFVTALAGYASGAFAVAGGLVWIPGHAALVGIAAACVAGYARSGLVSAWVVAYASLLGYAADHAFLGLSGRSVPEQVASFLRPDGLAVLAVEGVAIGTLGFVLGHLVRRGSAFLASRTSVTTTD